MSRSTWSLRYWLVYHNIEKLVVKHNVPVDGYGRTCAQSFTTLVRRLKAFVRMSRMPILLPGLTRYAFFLKEAITMRAMGHETMRHGREGQGTALQKPARWQHRLLTIWYRHAALSDNGHASPDFLWHTFAGPCRGSLWNGAAERGLQSPLFSQKTHIGAILRHQIGPPVTFLIYPSY